MRGVYMLIQLLGIGICVYPFMAKNALGFRIYNDDEAIVFVVIGIIVALFASAMERKEANKIKQENAMVKCPFCAEKIQPDAKICKHCGKEVTGNNA